MDKIQNTIIQIGEVIGIVFSVVLSLFLMIKQKLKNLDNQQHQEKQDCLLTQHENNILSLVQEKTICQEQLKIVTKENKELLKLLNSLREDLKVVLNASVQ